MLLGAQPAVRGGCSAAQERQRPSFQFLKQPPRSRLPPLPPGAGVGTPAAVPQLTHAPAISGAKQGMRGPGGARLTWAAPSAGAAAAAHSARASSRARRAAIVTAAGVKQHGGGAGAYTSAIAEMAPGLRVLPPGTSHGPTIRLGRVRRVGRSAGRRVQACLARGVGLFECPVLQWYPLLAAVPRADGRQTAINSKASGAEQARTHESTQTPAAGCRAAPIHDPPD